MVNERPSSRTCPTSTLTPSDRVAPVTSPIRKRSPIRPSSGTVRRTFWVCSGKRCRATWWTFAWSAGDPSGDRDGSAQRSSSYARLPISLIRAARSVSCRRSLSPSGQHGWPWCWRDSHPGKVCTISGVTSLRNTASTSFPRCTARYLTTVRRSMAEVREMVLYPNGLPSALSERSLVRVEVRQTDDAMDTAAKLSRIPEGTHAISSQSRSQTRCSSPSTRDPSRKALLHRSAHARENRSCPMVCAISLRTSDRNSLNPRLPSAVRSRLERSD